MATPLTAMALISNAAGPVDQTVELHLKFVKENYRVEGMADNVDEVSRVVKPGTQEFIMLEKIHDGANASLRMSFRYCQGAATESEEQIV